MAKRSTRAQVRQQLREASDAGRDVLTEVRRWQRVEINLFRMVAGGLALALPIAVGLATGRIEAGMVAALGALLVSGSGHAGPLRSRIGELLVTCVVGLAGTWLGLELGGGSGWSSLMIVALGVLAVVVGALRPSAAKASVQFIVFMIIGANLAQAPIPSWIVVGYMALGTVLGGALTLLAYGTESLIRDRPGAVRPPRRSWRTDLQDWRRRMGTLAGWHYPLRLGSCMLAAEIVAHVAPGEHSYWILLTVVLVVQRDHDAALTRTAQRGIGTAAGVVLGAFLLNSVPVWVTLAVVGLVGAVRGYLKAANYAAYTLVMTPLVTVLSGLGHPVSSSLLRERLVDTVIGCLISLLIGYFMWRRVRWTE